MGEGAWHGTGFSRGVRPVPLGRERKLPMAVRLRHQDSVRLRIQHLFWGVALCYVALMARLIWLQVVKGDYFMVRARDIRAQTIPQEAIRGGLLDRTGKPL